MTNAFTIPDKPLDIQRAYGKPPKTERVETKRHKQVAPNLKSRLERVNLTTHMAYWKPKDKKYLYGNEKLDASECVAAAKKYLQEK